MNPVPRWRIAAAIAVLVALAGFGVVIAPVYFHNLELQRYLSNLTHGASGSRPVVSEVRDKVLKKAGELDLPVAADNVHVDWVDGRVGVDVRYFVRVSLPFYTVDLHFHPGAKSE